MSRTAEFADVVLPGAPSVEKDGTFVNTERRIQRFYEVLPPLGGCRPDWRILTDLAARMGHDWGYTHPSQIMEECASISPMFAGVSYERLAGWQSLQWPVNADGIDTPLLYTEGFHNEDGKANLYPLEWKEPAEAPNDEYPFSMDNGRMLEHFQATNQTGRGPRIWYEAPGWFVEVSPELAEEHDIEDGTWVKLTSRRDSIEVRALVTDRVSGHTLFLPIHQGKPGVNALTGEHHAPDVDTPAYKETAVKLEVLSRKKGASPLRSNNFRFGQRTPKKGVEVEVKWDRSDYALPPAQLSNPRKM